MNSNLNLKNIKLIIVEFDGCISDGLIHLDKKGNQLKNFNIQDADLITDISSRGYKIGIISKYNISFMKKYFKKWNLAFLASKIDNKLEWINKYIKEKFIIMSQVAYFGCSISSLNIIESINVQNGLTGCPANSYKLILEKSSFVSTRNGGFGAVSDFLDLFNYQILNLNQNNNNIKYNLNQPRNDMNEYRTRRKNKSNRTNQYNLGDDSDTDERLNNKMQLSQPETTVNMRMPASTVNMMIPNNKNTNYSGDEWDTN
jgi:3-deoxy-D-manno-octulosonate 8-phosphate phosphatase (KDO 8-P phosphatase)